MLWVELALIIQCTLDVGGGYKAVLEAGIPPHSCPAVSLVDFDDEKLFAFVQRNGAFALGCQHKREKKKILLVADTRLVDTPFHKLGG